MRAGLIAGALLATLAVVEPAFGSDTGSMQRHRRRARTTATGSAPVTAGPAARSSPSGPRPSAICTRARTGSSASRRAATCAAPRATATTGTAGRRPTTTAGAGPARSTPSGGDRLRPVRRRGAELQRRPRLAAVLQRGVGLTSGLRAARRRHRPQPGTPAVDADQDGVPATNDCDDLNRQIYPGAPEVVGDGLDQDCSGADAAGKRERGGRVPRRQLQHGWTKFKSLRVTEAPAGAQVRVSARASARAARSRASSRPAPRAACR